MVNTEDTGTKSRKKQLVIVTIIAAIFAVSVYLVSEGVKYAKEHVNDPPPAATVQNVQTKTGNYQSYDGNSYSYEILYQQDDKRYAATFQPFLPNDDRSLVEATLTVFKVTYGNEAQIDPQPSIEMREGGNVIKFKADNGNYYVLPVKEDTGEMHTLVYWKE